VSKIWSELLVGFVRNREGGRRSLHYAASVEKHFQERTADLSTTLRSGRDDKGRAVRPGTAVAERESPKRRPLNPQVSPLRCAPVEMTRGRVVPPWTVAAEHKSFSPAWVGRRPMTSSGRDDKGKGGYFSEDREVAWTELGAATPQVYGPIEMMIAPSN
jgi:hypothetical protein